MLPVEWLVLPDVTRVTAVPAGSTTMLGPRRFTVSSEVQGCQCVCHPMAYRLDDSAVLSKSDGGIAVVMARSQPYCMRALVQKHCHAGHMHMLQQRSFVMLRLTAVLLSCVCVYGYWIVTFLI
jgi:hypothetical protein